MLKDGKQVNDARVLEESPFKTNGNKSASVPGLDMPLFSKRKQIADDCEEWCRIHDVPRHPQNIITAALKLGLLQIKEHI